MAYESPTGQELAASARAGHLTEKPRYQTLTGTAQPPAESDQGSEKPSAQQPPRSWLLLLTAEWEAPALVGPRMALVVR